MTVFGFPVYFRVSIMIAAALAVVVLREIGAIVVATLACSILVHELGHSFAFRRYGTESHIVVHLFGGYSSPDSPQRLSHNDWVVTSLAGPGVAFVLLGLPSLLLNEFTDLHYGYTGVVLRVLIYFNIYWGAINLLPLWPMDGGRVLYHLSGGNWQLTKGVTLILSVPAAILAVQLGFLFAALFVVFNAYQVFTSQAPGSIGGLQNSRITDATKQAKAYAAKPTKTRGEQGIQALDLVYQELLRGRADRAEEPLAALRKSAHREAAEVAAGWALLLSPSTSTSSTATPDTAGTSPLLNAVVDHDLALAAEAIGSSSPGEAAAALRVIGSRGELDQFCVHLASDASGRNRLAELERYTLAYGMVREQIRVTAALGAASS